MPIQSRRDVIIIEQNRAQIKPRRGEIMIIFPFIVCIA